MLFRTNRRRTWIQDYCGIIKQLWTANPRAQDAKTVVLKTGQLKIQHQQKNPLQRVFQHFHFSLSEAGCKASTPVQWPA